jgi:hypothetical protein
VLCVQQRVREKKSWVRDVLYRWMIEKDLTWCNGKLTVRCPPPFPPLHLSIYQRRKK